MSEPAPRATGHCLCEGIRYEVHGELRDVKNCHCDRCRRTTGHHMAATQTQRSALRFERNDTLQWYEVDTVGYGFCNRCGSSLFWRADGLPDVISICAGTLDPPTGLRTIEVLFTSTASDYQALDPNVPSWETEPP